MQALNILNANPHAETQKITPKIQKTDSRQKASFSKMLASYSNKGNEINSAEPAADTADTKKIEKTENIARTEKSDKTVDSKKAVSANADEKREIRCEKISYDERVPEENELLTSYVIESDLSVSFGQNQNAEISMAAAANEAYSDVTSAEVASANLTQSEIDYLKSSEDSTFADMIENAAEYAPALYDEEKLAQNQNLSVEEPEKFLQIAETVGEENNAAATEIKHIDAAENAVAQNAGVTQELPHASESKNEDFFKLEVTDKENRTVEARPLFDKMFSVTDERSVEQKIADFKEMTSDASAEVDSNSIDLTLSMTESAKNNILASNDQSASATGSTFQEMLTQQIQTNAQDFVKAGSIVLRDNKNGTINMNLKPEALGNVKISLEVSDKVITGQITVHSKEAFEAFKQNLNNLRQAFQDSGFQNAELNLSLADNSSNYNQGGQNDSSEQFFSNKVYGDYTVAASSSDSKSARQSYDSSSDSRISIVA